MVIVLIRKGYIVVTTTNNHMNNNDCLVQTWRLFQFFLGRLAVRAWLEHYICFSSDGYNCRCIITQSHEANQIHIQFTSTRVYQCFFTSRKSCYLSMFSLSAPENNFPTDQTDGIGCHFVFADRVKCSRIPFS